MYIHFCLFVGIYIGWRCPEFKHDCQRLNDFSKCFCGHLLDGHANYTGIYIPKSIDSMLKI
jgi:hypothetical protein